GVLLDALLREPQLVGDVGQVVWQKLAYGRLILGIGDGHRRHHGLFRQDHLLATRLRKHKTAAWTGEPFYVFRYPEYAVYDLRTDRFLEFSRSTLMADSRFNRHSARGASRVEPHKAPRFHAECTTSISTLQNVKNALFALSPVKK